MTIENLKKCKYGLTHNGTFHADDVFATAFIKMINPSIKIIRASSIPNDFKGIVYDIGNGLFDHHGMIIKKDQMAFPMRLLVSFGLILLPLFMMIILLKRLIKSLLHP